MSYQVLARKYRPKSFDTLVGQEHVVRALTHALDQKRLHHAYLFTGTRGVGKTTLSRILAKSFNCQKGITSQACGQCDACVAIDAGRFVDYIEMDAASNRGVDEMASLLEQAIYSPSNARFKVYMIDEVHMLTNHAFNAMLKTLEEPPEHVKFILATTDPQKIPVTVLSRCLQFNLKQMPPGHIVGHLENILGQEAITFEVPALRLLAQGAHGSMRDALSLTDQAIAYAAGKVSLDAVQNMLGALDQSYLIRLLDALASEDGAGMLAVADEMAARSLSYKAALQDLGSLLHQIAVAQLVPAALAEDLPERAELLRLAQVFSKEEVQLFYQIVVHGRNEIGLAPDEYAGFSMSLLRMLAFRPGSLDVTSGVPSAGGHGHGQSRALPTAATPVAARPAVMPPAMPVRPSPQAIVAPASAPVKPSAGMPAPVVVATEGAKAMNPAMAALAAARAASNQKMGQSTARTLPPLPLAAAPAVTTPAAVMAAPVSVAVASSPVVSPAKVTEHRAAVSTPPWEDLDYELSQASEQAKASSQDYDWMESEPTQVRGKLDRIDPAGVTPLQTQASVSREPLRSDSISNASAELTPALTRRMEVVSEVGSGEGAVSQVRDSSDIIPKTIQLIPMAELEWDGHWPNLAAALPVRGVAQQLAQQSELRACSLNGNAVLFKLCVPLQTLLSAGSLEKLTSALNERFCDFKREIRVEFEIGAVEQTANAQALAERAEKLVQAEQSIQSDGFVQTLIRDFGASILTGSIRSLAST